MKKQLLKSVLIGVAGFGLMTGTASAVLIDFTNTSWDLADGQTTFSQMVGGINVTAYSLNKLQVTNYDGGGNPALANIRDGLGTGRILEPDEINILETLKISFDPDVIVQEIYIYDFDGNDYARYMLEGGSWVNSAVAPDPNFIITTGSDAFVSWVKFESNSACSDYSLAAINTAVPEPATMLLFGTGIAGLAAVARRRKES